MNATKPMMFYVDQKWRRDGIHTPLLNPWWGNPLTESSLFTKQLHDTYFFDTSCYSITTTLAEADLVFVPYTHMWCLRHDPALLEECMQTARAADLSLLVDGTGDIEVPIKEDNIFVLRYGGYRFLPERGRIQIPLYADDLLLRYQGGILNVRSKGVGKPVVGFAGWVTLSAGQKFRTLLKEIPLRLRALAKPQYLACTKGVLWRQKALSVLERSPLVTLKAHVRDSFSGSAKTAKGDMRTLQKEMVTTILESDYALDVRGDANNSARLFEILSLGRIPVIIDTERNLPFSDEVDYSSFALVVDFRDIDRLPELVTTFHTNLSPERFEQMQKNARDAYVHYFRIDAMMGHIVTELQKKLCVS